MSKSKKGKLFVSLLASILCIGAIGGTSYYLYKLNNNETVVKYNVTLKYYFDGNLKDSFTKIKEFNKDELITLSDYELDLKDYKLSEDSLTGTFKVNEDSIINYYYITNKNIDTYIYLSNDNGLSYSYWTSYNLKDLNKENSESLTYVKDKSIERYDDLSLYTFDSSKSTLDSDNKQAKLYFYKDSGDNEDDVTPTPNPDKVNVYGDIYLDNVLNESNKLLGSYEANSVINLYDIIPTAKSGYEYVSSSLDTNSFNVGTSDMTISFYYTKIKEDTLSWDDISLRIICGLETSGDNAGDNMAYLYCSYNGSYNPKLTLVDAHINSDQWTSGDSNYISVSSDKVVVISGNTYSYDCTLEVDGLGSKDFNGTFTA